MLPITLQKLRYFCTLFRWGDHRDVRSSYLALYGKSTEVLKAFTASLAQWRFETLCVVFDQLCKLRAYVQNDFCLEMFATSKDKPCNIEAIARDRHFWQYVTWEQRFASMVDEHGRWGALCSCHEEGRRVAMVTNGPSLQNKIIRSTTRRPFANGIPVPRPLVWVHLVSRTQRGVQSLSESHARRSFVDACERLNLPLDFSKRVTPAVVVPWSPGEKGDYSRRPKGPRQWWQNSPLFFV